MMLDVDFVELRQGFLNYLPVGGLIGIVMLAELIIVLGGWYFVPDAPAVAAPMPSISNTAALGAILYTRYVYLFEVAGFVLLVAMIGAIVLTLQHKEGVRRQSIPRQNARTPATAMEVRKVESGRGL
jgi:NADH-quinone oxidoreductase subunit J